MAQDLASTRALQNRIRARKCRELRAMVENAEAAAILEAYAAELEARASEIERHERTESHGAVAPA